MAFFFDEAALFGAIRDQGDYLILSEYLPELLDDFLETAAAARPGVRFDILSDERTLAKLGAEKKRLGNWRASYRYVFSESNTVTVAKEDVKSIAASSYRGLLLCTRDSLTYRAACLKSSDALIAYAFELARVLGVIPVTGLDRYGTAVDYEKDLPGHAALRLALAYKGAGNFYEALKHFRMELRRFPFDGAVHRRLVHYLLDHRRPRMALAAVVDWREALPDSEWLQYEYGRSLMQVSRDREALKAILEEDRNFPGKVEVLDRLAELNLRLGDHKRAIQYYRQEADIQPDAVHPRIWLCRLMRQENRLREAEHYFREAQRLAPRDRRLVVLAAELNEAVQRSLSR